MCSLVNTAWIQHWKCLILTVLWIPGEDSIRQSEAAGVQRSTALPALPALGAAIIEINDCLYRYSGIKTIDHVID